LHPAPQTDSQAHRSFEQYVPDPGGRSESRVTECHTFTKDIYVTSLTPHMHYRGKSMKFEASYPDGHTLHCCSFPEYSFNWQITYRAEQPIFLPKGTRLNITAYFDNSANNPSKSRSNQGCTIRSGSETEMMSGWVEYVDQPPAILKADLRKR